MKEVNPCVLIGSVSKVYCVKPKLNKQGAEQCIKSPTFLRYTYVYMGICIYACRYMYVCMYVYMGV